MMDRETARECLTIGGRRTDDAEVDRFLEAVKDGIPVMPVTFFCDALKKWASLAGTPVPEETCHANENESRRNLYQQTQNVFTQIMKSNLLGRMIYGGEKPREKRCPIHKGRWSGCRLPEEMECKGACASGINVTGWLKGDGEEKV